MALYIEANDLIRRMRLQANKTMLGEITTPDLSYNEMLAIIEYAPTADVAPKSEVDKWYHEYHVIKDELKQEKAYHRETHKLADKYFAELQTAKIETAREIFAELNEMAIPEKCTDGCAFYLDMAELTELEKKYIGEDTNVPYKSGRCDRHKCRSQMKGDKLWQEQEKHPQQNKCSG